MIVPENSVLFWSGGKRSTKLLKILLKQDVHFDIVQIRNLLTKEQKVTADKLIIENDLKVFSYRPSARYFIDENTLIDEYAVTGSGLPIVRKLEYGDGCIAELHTEFAEYPPFTWATILVGNAPTKRRKVGNTEIWCPLWTKVAAAEYGRNRILSCSECLRRDVAEVFCHKEQQMVPTVKWDAAFNTEHYARLL